MKKRVSAFILALALTSTVFSGCGGKTEASSSAAPASAVSSAGANASGYNGKDNLKVSETPVTVKLFFPFGANGAPKGDMPSWKKAAEITNVSMENVANESITDVQQSLNTMLSAGELPDIIQSQRVYLTPIVEQGALIPLDDLINQYAPNIKKFFEDYPDAKLACSGTDGKIHFITGTLGGDPGKSLPSMGFFIRQDWLDKLNLKAPTTLEEYKNVLYAFRNNDPNGNGKKDEIPFFYRDKGVGVLVQLWNAHKSFYAGSDGKVHFGEEEPEYKAALKELAQWYKDGIIDPEIFTRGTQAREFLLGNNLGGSTVDWFASTAKVNDTVKNQVPGINFAAIAPPADVNGKVKQNFARDQFHDYGWGISKDCKDPVTVIKYMDFFMSDAGRLLWGYGIEGKSYTMENGNPKLTQEALSYSGGFPNYLRSIGSGYEIGAYGNIFAEESSMNKQAKDGFELYKNSDWLQKPFPALSFTAEEKKTIDGAMPNLQTYVDEYEQKCLMGAQNSDSTWDGFVQQLNRMGMDKVLEAYNSAYARYQANAK